MSGKERTQRSSVKKVGESEEAKCLHTNRIVFHLQVFFFSQILEIRNFAATVKLSNSVVVMKEREVMTCS